MNTVFRFIPLLFQVIGQLMTKDGLKNKQNILAAILMLVAGVQTMMPDLTATLGVYGPAVSAGLALIISGIELYRKKQKEAIETTVVDEPTDK